MHCWGLDLRVNVVMLGWEVIVLGVSWRGGGGEGGWSTLSLFFHLVEILTLWVGVVGWMGCVLIWIL